MLSRAGPSGSSRTTPSWGSARALLRERVVAAASRRQVILVERDKLVPRLGSRRRLPVEVVPFALPLCRRRLAALGLGPALRTAGERPFVTDNGNVILDCVVGSSGRSARCPASWTRGSSWGRPTPCSSPTEPP